MGVDKWKAKCASHSPHPLLRLRFAELNNGCAKLTPLLVERLEPENVTDAGVDIDRGSADGQIGQFFRNSGRAAEEGPTERSCSSRGEREINTGQLHRAVLSKDWIRSEAHIEKRQPARQRTVFRNQPADNGGAPAKERGRIDDEALQGDYSAARRKCQPAGVQDVACVRSQVNGAACNREVDGAIKQLSGENSSRSDLVRGKSVQKWVA